MYTCAACVFWFVKALTTSSSIWWSPRCLRAFVQQDVLYCRLEFFRVCGTRRYNRLQAYLDSVAFRDFDRERMCLEIQLWLQNGLFGKLFIYTRHSSTQVFKSITALHAPKRCIASMYRTVISFILPLLDSRLSVELLPSTFFVNVLLNNSFSILGRRPCVSLHLHIYMQKWIGVALFSNASRFWCSYARLAYAALAWSDFNLKVSLLELWALFRINPICCVL